MRQVELLERALEAITQQGFQIREECVGGSGGGICIFRNQKWFFVDPLLEVGEQLELACDALRVECKLPQDLLPVELRDYVFPETREKRADDEGLLRRAA